MTFVRLDNAAARARARARLADLIGSFGPRRQPDALAVLLGVRHRPG
jgi:hypothetical protein